MKINKFIVPAVAAVVAGTVGLVVGVRNSDRIKTSLEGFKEATEEKLKQLQEAAEESKKKVSEATEDAKKEAEEVAGKVAEAAAEIVDGGEKQPKQPRGKDGKFIKA